MLKLMAVTGGVVVLALIAGPFDVVAGLFGLAVGLLGGVFGLFVGLAAGGAGLVFGLLGGLVGIVAAAGATLFGGALVAFLFLVLPLLFIAAIVLGLMKLLAFR